MTAPSRRDLLLGGGALVVGFRLGPAWADAAAADPLPGSLAKAPGLDSWIAIEPSGAVTVFTGKAELGQGIKTALLQVAAEELDLPLGLIRIQTADTGLTPDEGYTAGSHSLQDSGTALRLAAAQARAILLAEAARRWETPAERLRTEDGAIIGPDGRHAGYGELIAPGRLHEKVSLATTLKSPADYRLVDHPVPRLDIPGKVTGGAAYVQDLRLPGMVHARVVRPPSYGAQLILFDRDAIMRRPGVIAVVHDGNFLAVAADKEFRAVEAMRALAASCRWQERAALPAARSASETLRSLPAEDHTILERRSAAPPDALRRLEASYTRPYQAHGSIGPSCAVAHLDGDLLTVWTHTQGVFPDREAIAELLGRPPSSVRCIHTEGSGCYGHNGADDAAGDAAFIAAALPGRPVRLQLMREQEAAWEPFGPGMATHVRAALAPDGTVVDWSYELWSNTHNMRPGGAGALLAGQLVARAFAPPPPKPIPQPEGGGDRNAIPLYRFPAATVVHHFVSAMPLRVSALRSLGAYANVFSIESFMDELAAAAGLDPVQFRLKHLDDPRAQAVVALAAETFGWNTGKAPGTGHGFGFARYKNLAAYCAIAAEAEVDRETGRVRIGRVVAAVDGGQVVNPDGLRNQVEGAIVQSASWTLFESVSFDERRITSVDWASYPILRFASAPRSVEVHIIPRSGLPYLGSGECGQGPAAAAIANAVADATGCRFRDLPLTEAKIRAGLASNENRPA